MAQLTTFLESWLNQGGQTLGQLSLRRIDSQFSLQHIEDVDGGELQSFHKAEDAREIAKYDAEGNFRPLKSAPTLKRGWKLTLGSSTELLRALDYFYPAAVANWVHYNIGHPEPSSFILPLRETLNRQTGMYRITSRIRDDEAQILVQNVCSEGKCLRTISWPIAVDVPIETLPIQKISISKDSPGNEIPVLCCQVCPILIGAAREMVKARNALAQAVNPI